MQRAPKYLMENSKKFFNKTIKEYQLEEHHILILIMACECLDRIEQARNILKKTGLMYVDQATGKIKMNVAAKIELDNKTVFARLIRELCLDIEPENRSPGRPPGLY